MAFRFGERLPPELVEAQLRMREHAAAYGLDFYETIFELVDYDQLNAIAAYGGFPTRYPHWRFGMEYEQLSKGYKYGLQKIYELVINNDPCYAYLMRSNSLTDQKLVMAHVYGHCDFFKNNMWFSQTNRKMMDEMANHGNRIRSYMDRFGVEEVENFIDCCLSIEDLIDVHSPFIRRREEVQRSTLTGSEEEDDELQQPGKFRSKTYMDRFINPPKVLAEMNRQQARSLGNMPTNFPTEPTRDIMLFVLEHAPLKPWQLDVLSIIRDEAYYFAPQGQTKIMNEGWASYWHSTIMTRHGLEPNDVVNYCDHNSGTLATSPGRLNPYKLGVELFRHIEDRWNRGKFGPEYEACDDALTRERWNTEAGLGREKIFEVRRIYNDVTFIDAFLTPEFCREQKMFSFRFNELGDYYEIESREFQKIKQRLLFSLTNRGQPFISVLDGNYKNRGELYLQHEAVGIELKLDYARDTLTNLQKLWTRPVHLETVLEDTPTVLSFDGSEHRTKQLRSRASSARDN